MPTAQPKNDPTADQAFPAENELPRADHNVVQALPGDVRPILRLDYDAHTELIRTLAVTDDGKYVISGGDDKNVHRLAT